MATVMVGTSDFIMLMLEEPEIVHELLDLRYASVLKCSHYCTRTGVI